MKTSFSPEHVRSFLQTIDNAVIASLTPLKEGQVSQAFGFTTYDGEEKVLRISDQKADFDADVYAAAVFGSDLLAPAVTDLDIFHDRSYYCISDRAPGATTDSMSDLELTRSLPVISKSLADIYHYDISDTAGYGRIDASSGDARHATWKSALVHSLGTSSLESVRKNAENIGVDPHLIDQLFAQYINTIDYASEERRLLHGDPAFDNMLVANGIVTANIDWAQAGYGDWVSDYSRLEFWGPGRYADIKDFAKEHQLDSDHLEERVALHWAVNALCTVEYADRVGNAFVSAWLRKNLQDKVVKFKSV